MDFNLAVMVAESARRPSGKPAVILGETKISYAQLDALPDRMAASLTAAGCSRPLRLSSSCGTPGPGR